MKVKIVPFNLPTLKYLRDFILENQILDTDSIALDERLFDELALDYRKSYGEPLKEPFIFLGVWIKIGDRHVTEYGMEVLLRNDPRPTLSDETNHY
jgi:hypothetical protein